MDDQKIENFLYQSNKKILSRYLKHRLYFQQKQVPQ